MLRLCCCCCLRLGGPLGAFPKGAIEGGCRRWEGGGEQPRRVERGEGGGKEEGEVAEACNSSDGTSSQV